ncbi:aldo/keto reductase [Bosea sp. (in: a-proteobacteria)]|uniref:aldo/keto reductase n=1 Tax=Bosea sp. (in: a-proteobacteria) TaxID=1871050 RepID=UPI00261E0B90|nr:aldo/keto reductase [Bosea sp. (in: a-proteobacteria)]MCO5090186.1 aldo/keto reductase [Bosea sp. (in: a-proteobacteria)]
MANATDLSAPVPPGRPFAGLAPSLIGFGGAPLGDLYGHLDEVTAQETVRAALAAGITLVDTSPLYGHGLSEHRIGAALRSLPRERVILSTKVGRWMQAGAQKHDGSGYAGGLPHPAVFDYSYDGAMRSLEQSLLRLGTDHVDILLIHDVDAWTHGAGVEQRFTEAMEGAYRALEKLRASGAVKAIGVGVNEAQMCVRFAQAGDFDVMMLAGRYSLLEQGALAAFLPLALEKKIAVMLAGVFNSGILATGAKPGAFYNYEPAPPAVMARVARIEAICAAHGVALPQAALAFCAAHPAVATIVLGAVTPQEVRRNLDLVARPVPAALWRELKAQGLIAAEAPVPEG